MSIVVNLEKSEPQPWMSYRNPLRREYKGKCCPALITNRDSILPFQIISIGSYVKTEISPYGQNSWSEIIVPITEVMVDGYYIISYAGEPIEGLSCGAYEIRVTAGEMWWFEPIHILDFEIETNERSKRQDMFLPVPFYEAVPDETFLQVFQWGEVLPFMYRTLNASSDPKLYLDSCGALTELEGMTVSTICGYTYYIFDGCPLIEVECNQCGYWRLRIVDGAFTYYSVPFIFKADMFICDDTHEPELTDERKVIYDEDGDILCEPKCGDIPPVPIDVEYGLLYNWYAATDVRDICSDGWHVPTQAEIQTLITYLAPDHGFKINEVSLMYWYDITNHTNSSLFNARGSGRRNGYPGTGEFYNIKEFFWCWTSDSNVNFRTGGGQPNIAFDLSYPNQSGFSIRPLKDSTTLTHGETGTYTGNDGKVYRTICIGTQEWVADNLCETKYRNGDTIPEVTDNGAWVALDTGALCAYNNDWNNV